MIIVIEMFVDQNDDYIYNPKDSIEKKNHVEFKIITLKCRRKSASNNGAGQDA